MNNDAYAAALAEIEEGRLDKGTWARAFAESGGDESKAKALYIKARAESTSDSAAWPDTQPPVEDVPKKRVAPGNGKDTPDNQPVDFYEAAIGEKNLDYYIGKFHAFDEKGPGLHASWNWAAFFGGGFWALYRKMYAWFFAWCFFGTVGTTLLKVPNPQIQKGVGIAYIAGFLGFAAFANALYHAKIKKRIDAAQKSTENMAQVNRKISSGSGVNAWAAYVFGVVPVLGIVAAVALPAFQDYSKRREVGATPVQARAPQVDWSYTPAPAPQETPVKIWENDKVVSPAPQSVTTAPSQIDDFLNGLPRPTQSDAQLPTSYVQKVRGLQAAVQRGEIPLTNGMASFWQPTNPAQWLSSDAAVLESTQTWWQENSNEIQIHVKNTMANPLAVLGIDYNRGACNSNGAITTFYLTPSRPIAPGSQSIVQFKIELPVSAQTKGCLVIVSAWS